MQTRPIQIADVIYNAADQCFEALVTVYDGDRTRKYPCAINAPITMPFSEAAGGLTKQALRRHNKRGGFYSEIKRRMPQQRAGRPAFDPLGWLNSIMHLPGNRAA